MKQQKTRKGNSTLYLIDGVRVPRKTYYRRQKYGEYAWASYRVVEVNG